ncbi:ArsR/SmtB family transcription factor [Planctomycetota bacterium]
MSNAVQLFKALADETRLRILNLIGHREVCVCQIVEALGLGQSKVSRHLAHLRNAGLVNDRREGLWIYYSLAQPCGRLHEQVVEWLRRAKDEVPMGAADLKALGDLGECGELCPDHAPSKEGEQNKEAAAVGS